MVASLWVLFISSTFASARDNNDAAKAVIETASDQPWNQPLVGMGVKTNDAYTDANLFFTLPVWSTIGTDGTLGGAYLFLEPYSSWGEQGAEIVDRNAIAPLVGNGVPNDVVGLGSGTPRGFRLDPNNFGGRKVNVGSTPANNTVTGSSGFSLDSSGGGTFGAGSKIQINGSTLTLPSDATLP